MTTTTKGLIVAAIHVAIVSSLGAKLLIDRATRPRVWARVAPVDPNLPIRGRYVRLRIEVEPPPELRVSPEFAGPVALSVKDDRLVATSAPESSVYIQMTRRTDVGAVFLMEPIAYFIPEHAADPSVRSQGEELWAEVTVPRAGAPRPIRLGVKKSGVLTPLNVR